MESPGPRASRRRLARAPLAQERVAPRKGGVLKVALNAEPPSLDLQWSTSLTTQQIGWQIYETLYTLDRQYNPIPLLAEGHTVSEGGRQYAIRLRRGVRFHNGREMTSADVVASLRRWGPRLRRRQVGLVVRRIRGALQVPTRSRSACASRPTRC
jgi:ABC-type transport system substrate-binding protein